MRKKPSLDNFADKERAKLIKRFWEIAKIDNNTVSNSFKNKYLTESQDGRGFVFKSELLEAEARKEFEAGEEEFEAGEEEFEAGEEEFEAGEEEFEAGEEEFEAGEEEFEAGEEQEIEDLAAKLAEKVAAAIESVTGISVSVEEEPSGEPAEVEEPALDNELGTMEPGDEELDMELGDEDEELDKELAEFMLERLVKRVAARLVKA